MTQEEFIEDLQFFEPKGNNPLQKLTDKEKAILTEQKDQREETLFLAKQFFPQEFNAALKEVKK